MEKWRLEEHKTGSFFFFLEKKKRQDRDSFEIFDDFDVIVWYKEHRYVSKKKKEERYVVE